MKLWSTLFISAAAWAMAMAWPKDTADNKLLENILQHYLESDSEAAASKESVQSSIANKDTISEVASEIDEDDYPANKEEDPSEPPVPASDEEYAIEEQVSTGFRHIYSLDMRVPTQQCPKTLQVRQHGSLRLCGKRRNGASCDSVIIPTYGKSYSRVRGRVRAYQYGSPDCFAGSGYGKIDSYYVDGVSVTHGKYPRKHVWTYAVAWRQYTHGSNPSNTCPSTGHGKAQPGFVGDNYFCSSANPGPHWSVKLYPTLLWSNIRGDCSDCGDDDLFFCVKLPKPTTDNLEVRICTDERLNNEDIRIEAMDFYIQ